jgi:hypothetical protein
MRGRARRNRQIEHEGQKAEPKRLRALGRVVERGGQRLGLFCVRLAGFRVLRQFVEHRPHPPAKSLASSRKQGNFFYGAADMAKLFGM